MDSNVLVWAIFATSVTGFLFLANWNRNLESQYAKISSTLKKVDEIHFVLMGDMKEEGCLSKLRRLEEHCKIRHGKKEDHNERAA